MYRERCRGLKFHAATLNYLLWYLGLRNRGLKTANFTVLLGTTMPAVLSESAFVTNPAEEALLADPAARAWVAEAHAYAICQHLAASAPASGAGAIRSDGQTADVRDGQIWVAGGGADARLTENDLVYSDVKVRPTLDKVLAIGSDYAGSRLLVIDLATGNKVI
ncbi:MAG: N-acetylmuramoyl-L-alanine amidase [Acidobacteriota bacterium]|nr:N-acetylmuramoyl-L-alanine amidase [Acidobacteriota bacterium]